MSGILIIEDDPAVSRLASLVLRSEGYEVRTACDGIAGLESLRRNEADLVVVDLAMPRMDGRAFVRAARCMGATARMVIFSAFGAKRAAAELSADGAIDKPFDPDDLVREVQRLVPAPA